MRNITVTSETLTQASDQFPLYQTTHDQAANLPSRELVFAPGQFGGHYPAHRLAGALATHAMRRGVGLKVLTYAEPLTGRGAYDLSYRAERFERVVEHVGRDHPVDAIAHSRAWTSAVIAGESLAEGEYLRSLIGLTPTDPYCQTLPWGLAKEAAVSLGFFWRSPAAVKTAGRVAWNAFQYFHWDPEHAIQDTEDTLNISVAGLAASLSRDVLMGVTTAEYDGLFGKVIEKRLKLLGFQGRYDSLATTHLGALADPLQYGAIYDFAHGIAEDAAKIERFKASYPAPHARRLDHSA